MRKFNWTFILIIANLVAINWAMIRFLNLSYPIVGHDYGLDIPAMLDIYLHYHLNGLSIQWYTPSFGGGVPAFPDPNNGQFSLSGLMLLLANPWQAVIIPSILYISLGGLVSYYFFKHILKLHWMSSILGMVFFSANGFIMERLAVGHFGYCAYPLIAILIVTLMDPSIRIWVAGVIFSLVVVMLTYGAGYFLIIVFGLVIIIVLPLVYIYNPALFSWKRILAVLAIGASIALVVSASKLAAVYAFMRFFPRQIADSYHTSFIQGLFGIFMQLLGTMTLAPLLKIVGLNPGQLTSYMIQVTGAVYGYWEFDMSVTPVVFGILIIGGYSILRKPKKYSELFKANKKWIAWILFFFFSWLTIEFTLGKGLIYPYLQHLPILSSLHVNPRFAVAFILPLALCAALFYDKWTTKWSSRKALSIFLLMDLAALLPLAIYFMIHTDLQYRAYDMTASQKILKAIQSGNDFTVTGIVPMTDNTQALLLHESNLGPYDPVFGYQLENFHPEIHVGSIWDISDGYYNMTNPSGYVFPEINGTRPFERIKVGDEENLKAFVAHRLPNWKIPLYQQILDLVSGLTFIAVAGVLLIIAVRQLVVHIQWFRIATLRNK